MDIEGWEGPVLRGGSQLLAAHGDNLLLEYSPGIFERRNMTDFAPQARSAKERPLCVHCNSCWLGLRSLP